MSAMRLEEFVDHEWEMDRCQAWLMTLVIYYGSVRDETRYPLEWFPFDSLVLYCQALPCPSLA
jgi:hypothetical protein